MQVLSHTFTYFSTQSPWTLRHLSYRDTNLLIPSSYQKAAWLFYVIANVRWYNFVHNCMRHFRTLFIHFANCEMSILSNDVVLLLLQCICDDRGSPRSLSVINICSPIPKHCAPFSDTGRVHNMFAIDCNKSSVNFTGSNVFCLQKPKHASHLTVGGIWYQRVHCHKPLHSQCEKVRCTNCTR